MAPDHGKVDRSKGPAMGLPLQGRLAFLDRWKGSAGAAWDPHHAPPSIEPKWLQKQLPYIARDVLAHANPSGERREEQTVAAKQLMEGTVGGGRGRAGKGWERGGGKG